MPYILVSGGVRGGKTRIAQIIAQSHGPNQLMLATCHCQDAEMAARVAAHKKNRGPSWLCVEEPLEPLGAISAFLTSHPDFQGAVAIDSIGMWINNLMGQNLSKRDILLRVLSMSKTLKSMDILSVIVSEECGLGFTPIAATARKYGDILGSANQILARGARAVLFVACGIPLALKGQMPACLENDDAS